MPGLNFEKKEDRPFSEGREAKTWHLYIGDPETRLSNYKNTLLNIFESRGVQSVYDVACATGIDSFMLLEEGYQVVSTDACEHFFQEAKEKRAKRPDLGEWQIGFGDWLDLKSADVKHPAEGYDAILCIGNSFTMLPDFEGDGGTYLKALQNFKDLLKVGGVLVIDHRNNEYLLKNKTFPPDSHNSIYYNSERTFNVKTDLVEKDGEIVTMIFNWDIDVSNSELENDPDVKFERRGEKMVPTLEMSGTPCFPHSVKGFTGLLRSVFGDDAEHRILPDFKEKSCKRENLDFVPNFWVHVITKSD